MMTITKITEPRWLRAGAILVYLAGGMLWSTYSRADEEFKPEMVAVLAPVVAPATAATLRLPALKVGGIGSGEVLLITGSGAIA